MPRLYEPIWKTIKNTEKPVTLHVKQVYAARVKKAVIKEKWMDAGFKILNDAGWFLEISYDSVKQLMTFHLKRPKFGIEDLVKETGDAKI